MHPDVRKEAQSILSGVGFFKPPVSAEQIHTSLHTHDIFYCTCCCASFENKADELKHTGNVDWQKCKDCKKWFLNAECMANHHCCPSGPISEAAHPAPSAGITGLYNDLKLNHSDVCKEYDWVSHAEIIFTLLGPLNGNCFLVAQMAGLHPTTVHNWVKVKEGNKFAECWYETVKDLTWGQEVMELSISGNMQSPS